MAKICPASSSTVAHSGGSGPSIQVAQSSGVGKRLGRLPTWVSKVPGWRRYSGGSSDLVREPTGATGVETTQADHRW